jgi:hypothetical protein
MKVKTPITLSSASLEAIDARAERGRGRSEFIERAATSTESRTRRPATRAGRAVDDGIVGDHAAAVTPDRLARIRSDVEARVVRAMPALRALAVRVEHESSATSPDEPWRV